MAYMYKSINSLYFRVSLQEPFPNSRTSSTKSKRTRITFPLVLIRIILFASLEEIASLIKPSMISRKSSGENGHPRLSLLEEEKKDEADTFINNVKEGEVIQLPHGDRNQHGSIWSWGKTNLLYHKFWIGQSFQWKPEVSLTLLCAYPPELHVTVNLLLIEDIIFLNW